MSLNRTRLHRAHELWNNGLCYWCTIPVRPWPWRKGPWPHDAATRDHLTPASRGGSDDSTNLVLACFWCNTHRGDRPVSMWETSYDLECHIRQVQSLRIIAARRLP